MAIELSDTVKGYYTKLKELPDGRICGVHRLLYHWTMHIGIDEFGYSERYCFQTREMAETAMHAWDGTDDPILWHRHPDSGRRRDPVTGVIEENAW